MAAEESGSGVGGVGGGEAPAPAAPNGDRSGNSTPAAESSSAGDLLHCIVMVPVLLVLVSAGLWVLGRRFAFVSVDWQPPTSIPAR
jgi:hypothetical protein